MRGSNPPEQLERLMTSPEVEWFVIWLRGLDLDQRSRAYETRGDDQTPLPRGIKLVPSAVTRTRDLSLTRTLLYHLS